MKTLAGMTVLAALLMAGSVTSVQAGETMAVRFQQAPQLLLAEGGSERLLRQQQQMEVLASQRVDPADGERFVQLIKEQPTAAGGTAVERPYERQPDASFMSPIHRDRALFGSPH
ncbi:hypothetical protein D3C72_1771800 [compost metagenome]